MDEREMLTDDQIFDWLSEIADEEIMASNRASIIEVGRRIEQAARRTTPDREAGLEDAALLMEQRAAEIEACGGLTAGTMARIYRDEASKIRALKTAATISPRDTLIEEIAEMVDHMGEGRRLEEYVGAIREMKGGNR